MLLLMQGTFNKLSYCLQRQEYVRVFELFGAMTFNNIYSLQKRFIYLSENGNSQSYRKRARQYDMLAIKVECDIHYGLES